jgi:hypothetical protein
VSFPKAQKGTVYAGSASAADALEPLVALPTDPEALAPVTRIRSTLLTSSLKTLDERGLRDRYFQRLAQEHHGSIRDLIAGVWVPTETAVAHYRACDALGLSPVEQLEIGLLVGQKIQGTLLGTLVTLTKQAGATPWTFLGRLNRLYDRLVIGGGLAVYRVAAKEAVVSAYNVPLFAIPYFATAWRGVIQGLCELFCSKAYVKSGTLATGGKKMTYVVSWA